MIKVFYILGERERHFWKGFRQVGEVNKVHQAAVDAQCNHETNSTSEKGEANCRSGNVYSAH